jgi:hypothetical protein
MMIRVFPTRTAWTPTDELAFVGHPPLFQPGTPDNPVRITVAVTWDLSQLLDNGNICCDGRNSDCDSHCPRDGDVPAGQAWNPETYNR